MLKNRRVQYTTAQGPQDIGPFTLADAEIHCEVLRGNGATQVSLYTIYEEQVTYVPGTCIPEQDIW